MLAKIQDSALQNPAALPIGVDQTWQDVRGSRVDGEIYTNLTGRPIMIYLEYYGTSGAGSIIIGGVAVASLNSESGSGEVSHLPLIIPTGATYVVNEGSQTVSKWVELR